jgi:uncharacterized protein YbjQ (UPF0145 family)
MMRSGICHGCQDAIQRLHGGAAEPRQRRQPLILVTTPTIPGRDIDEAIGIVSAQVAFGMNVFKDIATAWRDVFGGRANSLQGVLADSRKHVLAELTAEAKSLGADAVVGIDLDMSEFSVGNGMVMLTDSHDLAAQVKAWRGKVPAREAAEILGIPRRTFENIEQGRGFPYPQLLLIALKATDPNEGKDA